MKELATKGTCEDCRKEAILVRCLTCEKPPKDCTCNAHQKEPKHICGACYDRRIRQNPRTLSRENDVNVEL